MKEEFSFSSSSPVQVVYVDPFVLVAPLSLSAGNQTSQISLDAVPTNISSGDSDGKHRLVMAERMLVPRDKFTTSNEATQHRDDWWDDRHTFTTPSPQPDARIPLLDDMAKIADEWALKVASKM